MGRPRGKKAAGVKYEKALAKALPGAEHGVWFQFVDSNGPGFCQADLLLRTAHGTAVLEAKYTWVASGHGQADRLYVPIVEKITGRPAFSIVVCKVVTRDTPREWICRTLQSALDRAARDLPTVLHWIGGSLDAPEPRPTAGHLAHGLAVL